MCLRFSPEFDKVSNDELYGKHMDAQREDLQREFEVSVAVFCCDLSSSGDVDALIVRARELLAAAV